MPRRPFFASHGLYLIGPSLAQTVEEEVKVISSPETEAAEDSLAGPAVDAEIMDSGRILGLLIEMSMEDIE